jgi:hypothetical protein
MVNSPISSSVNRFTSGVISISSSTALSAALLELFVFVFVAMHSSPVVGMAFSAALYE